MKKEEQMEQVSSNPEQQKNYEFFERGYNNGELDERERIIKLLDDTVNVYLADKLLFEAAIIANAIACIKVRN